MKRVLLTAALILTVSCYISAQGFFDDFESYNVGEQLVVQNPIDWTTWSNTPGSVEDPYIENIEGNVVQVNGLNDFVYPSPNYTSGFHWIKFDLYIPSGCDAYFNTLQEYTPVPSWGMQVYFGHTNPGEGNIDASGALAQLFTFEYDTWLEIRVEIDLDADWGEFYLNDQLIHGWIWSTGCFGTNSLNQLGGSNFYAWDGGVFANPNYYIDNYCFNCGGGILDPPINVTAELISDNDVKVDWDPPSGGGTVDAILQGYNVYENGTNIGYVAVPITEYDVLDLDPGTYEYCVSAVYDEGESMLVCADEVFIPPPAPTNLTGPDCYFPGDTIHLTWEYNCFGEWIRWDGGYNTGNGIGTGSGGTFSCASHWYPDQLMPYDGLQLKKIKFFANGDPDAIYTIKVWIGEDGTNEVLSQEVYYFAVDDWNTVVLNTPHTISAAEDLWFGYEVTHGAGTFPAGCDDGPAIPYNGDMINAGGFWGSMSVDWGLDYNWNLAGFVVLSDDTTIQSIGKMVQFPDSYTDLFADCLQSNNINLSPNGTKDFEYFNVYVKFPGSSFFAVLGPVSMQGFDFVTGESGQYEFFVTAVWDPEGESYPSNIWVVDLCTGIINKTINYIEIFPNPASDIVTIKSELEIVSLKVYNPTGQIVAEEVIKNNIYRFDASLFNPGIYFLQINFEDDRILRKIVIE